MRWLRLVPCLIVAWFAAWGLGVGLGALWGDGAREIVIALTPLFGMAGVLWADPMGFRA